MASHNTAMTSISSSTQKTLAQAQAKLAADKAAKANPQLLQADQKAVTNAKSTPAQNAPPPAPAPTVTPSTNLVDIKA